MLTERLLSELPHADPVHWMREFLSSGVSPNVRLDGGVPLVMWVARIGRPDIAGRLLSAGASLDSMDECGHGLYESVLRHAHFKNDDKFRLSKERMAKTVLSECRRRHGVSLLSRKGDGLSELESAFVNGEWSRKELGGWVVDEFSQLRFIVKSPLELCSPSTFDVRSKRSGDGWLGTLLSILSPLEGLLLLKELDMSPDFIHFEENLPVGAHWFSKEGWGDIPKETDPLDWMSSSGVPAMKVFVDENGALSKSLLERVFVDPRFAYAKHEDGGWSYAMVLDSKPSWADGLVRKVLSAASSGKLPFSSGMPFGDWLPMLHGFSERDVMFAVENGLSAPTRWKGWSRRLALGKECVKKLSVSAEVWRLSSCGLRSFDVESERRRHATI